MNYMTHLLWSTETKEMFSIETEEMFTIRGPYRFLKSRLPNFSNTDILGWVNFCFWGCPVYCRTITSISGIYPQNAKKNPSLVVTTKNVSRLVKYPWIGKTTKVTSPESLKVLVKTHTAGPNSQKLWFMRFGAQPQYLHF